VSIAGDVTDRKARPGTGRRLRPATLLAKGIALFLVLSLYVLGAAGLLVGEAMRLLESNMALRERAVAEAALAGGSAELLRILGMLDESVSAGEERVALRAASQALAEVARAGAAWRAADEALFERLQAVRSRIDSTDAVPGAADSVRELEAAFARRAGELRREVRAGEADFRDRIEAIIVVALVVALLGLATFGAFLTLFFGRVARDLGRVQARALEVAKGYCGPPLDLGRDDELGALASALNRMAQELAGREREIALGKLRQFHQERMALLGGIAAGIAHELGNPAAAIAAIAAEAATAAQRGEPPPPGIALLPGLAERIAAITRQLGNAVSARAERAGPLSLNASIEATVALLRFDRRFSRLQITLELDPRLPLVRAAEDDIVQLLMHLMVNAAEALAGAGGAAPCIRIATRRKGEAVELSISDNGRGMDERTLARAFEPFFTTKPEGRGHGLGLDACRQIAQRAGGTITLQSRPGCGTRAVCRFPVLATI
jgi:two-component system NtrC family sensor kinase